MPQAEEFLRFLSLRLVEDEGLDRVPGDARFRDDLGPIFSEILAGERSLALFVLADDRPIDECRRALDVFETLREQRKLPLGLDTIVVTFLHGGRCPPERVQELLRARPAKDVALFRVETRVIDVEAARVSASAGWMGQGRPAVSAMEKALQLWAGGAARGTPPADLDRAVEERHVAEERFFTALQGSRPWVSYTLFGILGIVFLSMHLVGSSTRTDTLIRFGAKVNPLIRAGDWWRLFSCTCLHIGLLHLLFNGYGLWAVGPTIERYFGGPRFIVLYFFAGFLGSLASFVFTPALSAGASGALCGLLGAILIMGWTHGTTIPRRVRSRLVSGLGTVILFNLMLGLSTKGIDNYAHAGGFVGGALAALLIRPKDAISGKTTSLPKKIWLALLGAVPAVALALAVFSCFMLGRDPLYFPTRVFADATGILEIDYPALLEPRKESRGFVLDGTGMQVRFFSEGYGLDPVPDLDTAAEREIRSFEDRDRVRAERMDTRTIGGQAWVALNLDAGSREPGRALIALIDRRRVVLEFRSAREIFDDYSPMLERIAATVRPAKE